MGWSVLEGNISGLKKGSEHLEFRKGSGMVGGQWRLPDDCAPTWRTSNVGNFWGREGDLSNLRWRGNRCVTMPSGHRSSGVASRARHHIVNELISGCCPAQRLAPGLKA